ncbi:MAG: glutaredoxin family protein [Syntrophobacteraceae bacterium]
MGTSIILYGLLSCAHCKEARSFLMDRGVPFECVYVDMLLGEERNDTMREIRRLNPEVSFPTVVIGDRVITGFKRDQIEQALAREGL